MKTELIMDEGEEKKESSISANAPEVPSPIATSLLDRFFASRLATKIASGVFGALSLGSATAAHADKIAANQAVADAFAGQTPGPTVDKIASPEQKTLTEYSVTKFSISGNRIAALVETADGKTKIGVGDLDASGNVVLKEVSPLPFHPLDIKVSKNNPNFLFAVGDRERRVGEGWSAVSRDGGQTWQSNKTGGSTAYRGEITPDDHYGIIVEADIVQENTPRHRYLDFTSNAQAKVAEVVTAEVPLPPIRLGTSLMAASQPGKYKGVGASGPRRGYWLMEFSPQEGTVTVELQHEDEGFPMAELVAYQDQGQDWVWLGNNDTAAADNPMLPRGTIYINADNVKKYEVQEQLSSTDLIAFIGAFTADPKGGGGYIGSDVMFSYVDNRYRARVERFAIAAPNDTKQRVLFSEDGWLTPQGDNDSVQITSLRVLESDGKRFLVAGLTRKERILDLATNTWIRKVAGGGLLVQDITVGAGDRPWKAVNFTLKSNFSIYLPTLTRSHAGGW